MTKIAPKKISGEWNDGYALDFHTLMSTLVGYDEFGHERYLTTYTEIGELLYGLKYRGDRSKIAAIVDIAAEFVTSKKWKVDLVIPVPPSKSRHFQPVMALAEGLARKLGVKFCGDCIVKVRDTPELKNEFDPVKRAKSLKGAFNANGVEVKRKAVLLFDDLYRSGATANEICSTLIRNGGASAIYVLTVTKTRTLQ